MDKYLILSVFFLSLASWASHALAPLSTAFEDAILYLRGLVCLIAAHCGGHVGGVGCLRPFHRGDGANVSIP